MDKKISWFTWLTAMVKEFLAESSTKPQYEVVELYECEKTGVIKAIIKLSGRHIIERSISEIIADQDFIEEFDKKTIRALTYMATLEKIRPDHSITMQQLGEEIDDCILEIKSRKNKVSVKKSPSDIISNKAMLAKFNPIDANRIGYLAGVRETVKEFQIKNSKTIASHIKHEK